MVAGPPAAAPAARGGAYRRACYVHMSFYRTFHVVGHVIGLYTDTHRCARDVAGVGDRDFGLIRAGFALIPHTLIPN
jgi:hypothetical protein